jgi:hypothetical protein
MTEFLPVPEPRKTVTHASCTVATPLGVPAAAARPAPADAMRAAGHRAGLLAVEGAGHVLRGAPVEIDELTEAGADFLDETLKVRQSRGSGRVRRQLASSSIETAAMPLPAR